jgi:hypothetical protein
MNGPELNIRAVKTSPDEFVPFWKWMRHATGFQLKLVGGAGVFVPLLAVTYYATGILKNTGTTVHVPTFGIEQLVEFSYLAQIIVIFGLLIMHAAFILPARDARFEIGTEGQKRLRFWWSIALFAFLVLYIVLFIRAWGVEGLAKTDPHRVIIEAVFGVVANLCNNASTLAFLMCFSTMETPTGRNESKNDNWVLLWLSCLIMVTFAEAVARFAFASAIANWDTAWFDVLTGASAGIALAMFCGRLASPLLNPPISVMVLLYLYAVVQISFGFWTRPAVALVMGNVCLMLKCLLSFVIAWLLSTHHLIFYMERLHGVRGELLLSRNQFRRQPLVNVNAETA